MSELENVHLQLTKANMAYDDLLNDFANLNDLLTVTQGLFTDIWEFSDRLPDDIRDRVYEMRKLKEI